MKIQKEIQEGVARLFPTDCSQCDYRDSVVRGLDGEVCIVQVRAARGILKYLDSKNARIREGDYQYRKWVRLIDED